MVKAQDEIPDDEVRQEILRGALTLYLKHSPDKVTMDDVANAIGRSRTSLYYYYKNHSEIYQAVLSTMSPPLKCGNPFTRRPPSKTRFTPFVWPS
jgi:AcrR family transcriptional regulator